MPSIRNRARRRIKYNQLIAQHDTVCVSISTIIDSNEAQHLGTFSNPVMRMVVWCESTDIVGASVDYFVCHDDPNAAAEHYAKLLGQDNLHCAAICYAIEATDPQYTDTIDAPSAPRHTEQSESSYQPTTDKSKLGDANTQYVKEPKPCRRPNPRNRSSQTPTVLTDSDATEQESNMN